MNDFSIDEMIQQAAYAEWMAVMEVTEEQDALLDRPFDKCEVVPKLWIEDDGKAISQKLELYMFNVKKYRCDIITVLLYATRVEEGETGFRRRIFENYLVVGQVIRRLGRSGLLTYEKWKEICYMQFEKCAGRRGKLWEK